MEKVLTASRFVQKLRLIKTRTKIIISVVGLLILGGSVAGLVYYKQKQADERMAMYMHELDNVVPVMTVLISLSDDIRKYRETKPDDMDAWAYSNLATKLEGKANTLTALQSNDPVVSKAILATMALKEAFDRESVIEVERKVLRAALAINNTLDVNAAQTLQVNSMQNAKVINKAEKDLGEVSGQFFQDNSWWLTDDERQELLSQINSRFEDIIKKYNKRLKKAEDYSKVEMFVYEWGPIYIYRALNA